MRRGLTGLLVVVPLVAAACGGTPAPASPAAASIAAPPSSSDAVASPAAPASPGASVVPGASAAPASPGASAAGVASPGASVALDASLLAILPPEVDGVAVVAEPDAFAAAAADPDFVRNVESAAFALAVDGSDLASGVIARLRPGRYSDALFRDWRDTYDAGACSRAGGVAGTAETQLGGRTVHIANCAGGLLVYHAYLPERDAIVSMFSLGDRRFGEKLMSGLRP
jgi:hypothetical protein